MSCSEITAILISVVSLSIHLIQALKTGVKVCDFNICGICNCHQELEPREYSQDDINIVLPEIKRHNNHTSIDNNHTSIDNNYVSSDNNHISSNSQSIKQDKMHRKSDELHDYKVFESPTPSSTKLKSKDDSTINYSKWTPIVKKKSNETL